jgi:hypothetical protein
VAREVDGLLRVLGLDHAVSFRLWRLNKEGRKRRLPLQPLDFCLVPFYQVGGILSANYFGEICTLVSGS